jgi:leucyl-tRNA synthetase
MPVFVADFVLEQYGTGAVFADAHDSRDFKFAKKYGVALKTSIEPEDKSITQVVKNLEVCHEGEGTLYNSLQFNGLKSPEAKPKIIEWLKEKGLAEHKTS